MGLNHCPTKYQAIKLRPNISYFLVTACHVDITIILYIVNLHLEEAFGVNQDRVSLFSSHHPVGCSEMQIIFYQRLLDQPVQSFGIRDTYHGDS